MAVFGKLFKLWAMSRAVSLTAPSISRILTGVATIAVLVLIASILIGVSLVGVLYISYHMMLLHGITPVTAMGIMATVVLMLITGCLVWAWFCWRRIQNISKVLMLPRNRVVARAQNVANSFLDGLLGQNTREEL